MVIEKIENVYMTVLLLRAGNMKVDVWDEKMNLVGVDLYQR